MAIRKDFVGLHRLGLADAYEDEVVEDAFRRQREVHDLGEVQIPTETICQSALKLVNISRSLKAAALGRHRNASKCLRTP